MNLTKSLSLYVFWAGVVFFSAAPVYAQDFLQARALLQAVHQVKISSEIQAKINHLGLLEGDRFKKGDVLVGFECSLLKAHVRVKQAILKGEQKTLANKKQLMTLQSVGELEVALASAAVEKAQGELDIVRYATRQCEITAPFNGRVVKKNVNPFETVAPGDILLEILDDQTLEVALVVPSNWLSWLKPGTPFELTIDETGEQIAAKIVRTGAWIDPVSQSISVFGEINNVETTKNLLAGMSGSAVFENTGTTTQ
ncbi:hypothetical protein GCM10011332_05680 [Terasakiella brassicae]|uniref:Efflux transporter periplasmic adaptor subunit n=1 Tax=Terasakiella brassicae TaxID=1634917 RepID=A0A917BSJ2_9PROT|nr:efflux RND transporter periplasmic adaptor subunit [Terasakiella brassicae]GGF55149.1 hypothetical protein GCM10011332_05680 [Terasakiella brassicae]